MATGHVISGVGHAGVILWVLLGGLFTARDAPEPAVTEVSLLTGAEFAALMDRSTPDLPEAPAASPTPEAPEPTLAAPPPPEPEEPPAPEPAPAPAPEPAPAPVEATPAPAPEPEVVEAPPEPAPAEPVFEEPPPPAPAVVADVPPVLAPETSPRPRPKPAERVAPVPVEAPPPEAVTAPEAAPEVTPEPTPAPVVVVEDPPAAPEEAGTELATEANRPDPLAPSASVRPRPRPAPRPVQTATAPAPTPAPTPTTAATPAPAPSRQEDAVAAAVAAAVAGATATGSPAAPRAPSGPPMTSGEKDNLRRAVSACWNLGTASTEAMNTTVVVLVTMSPDARPQSITLQSSTGGSEAGTRAAFDAARRAIQRCGQSGFPLPADKYEQWRDVEMVFNPDGMRLR